MKFGPYPFPDEALKMIKTPTLLLMGDHEILYLGGPDQAIKRAEELVANIQTVLIPNASHLLLWEQTELVNSHILNFLSGGK
jgi:pimeloyl-ACP methyl ester carboxylesterase